MLILLVACSPGPDGRSAVVPPSLTERLGGDQVRAGEVTDAAALFGGISAEGAVGDYKIYNDRVQFVVQAPGDSSYYVEYGGGLVDADLVREEGVPGRDIVDEMTPMIGLGRAVDATSVTVVSDGGDGEAVLRVEGRAAPMHLVTGALESPSLVPDLDLRVRTDFALAPGSWSLKATTTVWNDEDDAQALSVGELGLLAMDVAEAWRPGTGRADAGEEAVDWVGALAVQNEVALALSGDGAPLESGPVARILASFAPGLVGFGPTETVAPGDSISWSRWIGVAPDLATLTGEALVRDGTAAQTVTGTVTATSASGDAGVVAGARVHVLDAAGAPLTVAITDAAGAWSATVPAGTVSYVASGRGRGLDVDLPAGHGWLSPYESDPAATLATLRDGAAPLPFAEGYGVSAVSASPALTLVAPGQLHVTVADGGPAVVRVAFPSDTGDLAVVDDRLVPGRPSGDAAYGFVRDGDLDLPLEPGDYDVVVYRGVRDELVHQAVTIVSGGTTDLAADIVPAYVLDGVLTGDPHSHASPSSDGGLPMADRILVTAANGIDLHFGTDHDHIVDYRPLLVPLGLDARLRSIVADEVSPVLRGHFNSWPATVDASRENGGAPRWWFGYADTAEIFGWMRGMFGTGTGIISANHPVGDSGMFTFAAYSTAGGTIGEPDHWSSDFDAMELLNSNDWADYLPYYLDLVSRGHVVTPLGVSDSHTHTSGGVGVNITFFDTGGTLGDLDDAALLAAMARHATVVSHGPYIDARVDGTWAPGATIVGSGTLTVDVKAPSWMPVETVSLYEDGVVVATEPCTGVAPTPCTATWTLAPAADASYVVIAASTTLPMVDAHPGQLAWAATAATLVDVAGDGWTAPLPPLVESAR
jgi:hypothetical protein